METTVDGDFTTSVKYISNVSTLQKETEKSFSCSVLYSCQTVGTGTQVLNSFTTSQVYSLEDFGFSERILRVKRGTTLSSDRKKSFSTIQKRISIIEAIKGLKAEPYSCGNIRSCVSLKKKTATIVDIRRNDDPFTTEAKYITISTFSPSVDTERYLKRNTTNEFTTKINYFYETRLNKKLQTPFVCTPIYSFISEIPKKTDNLFSANPVYKLVGERSTEVSNTFTTTSKYDFFVQSGIAEASNTFTTTPTYSCETVSVLTQTENTFTTSTKYDLKSIIDFFGIGKSFNTSTFYDLKTFFEQKESSQNFNTSVKYSLESISEFKNVGVQFSASGSYTVDTISIFKETSKNFVTNSIYSAQTIADVFNPENSFSTTPIFIVSGVTRLKYLTDATFTKNIEQAVYSTQLLEAVSSLDNNGWLSANQGGEVDDISGQTPNDSTGITHFSVSSTDRSISFDYGINNLSFLEERDNHTIKVRYYSSSGLGSVNITIDVISDGSVVRSQTYSNVGQSIIQRDIVLTESQANSVDYDDVQLRFTAGTNDGSNKQITITWGVIEVPEVV